MNSTASLREGDLFHCPLLAIELEPLREGGEKLNMPRSHLEMLTLLVSFSPSWFVEGGVESPETSVVIDHHRKTEEGYASRCTLCADGLPYNSSYADKELPFLFEYLGFIPTCAEWDANITANNNISATDCANLQAVSTICGCAPKSPNSCHLCPDGQSIADPHKLVPFAFTWLGFEPTCDLWDAFIQGGDAIEGTRECTEQRVFSEFCGCKFYDFDTDLWRLLCRVSASLSLVASLSLLIYILSDAKRRSSTYHQIIMGISSFDVLSSIFFVLADIPQPDYTLTKTGLEEVDTSFCTAQGFFLQLGFTSMFFNVSLTLFYMLTIAQGWTEGKVRRARVYFLTIPFSLGLILACAGIPFYDGTGLICHLPPIFMTEVFGGSSLAVILIAIVPICCAITAITAMQGRIFWYVRKSEQKMLRWRFSARKLAVNDNNVAAGSNANSSGNSSKTNLSMTKREQKVFWQSVFYVGSFYITWPIVLASFLLHPDRYDDPLSAAYRIENATFFLWPIQGLLTCLVYFRPRIIKGLSKGANKMKNLSLLSANKKAVASTKANSSHDGNMGEQGDVEKAGRI